MLLPKNSVRRKIIKDFMRWWPNGTWTGRPMEDAEILIRECRRLIPHVTIMYRNLIEQDNLRRLDIRYRECLSECSHEVAERLRAWLFGSPYLQEKPTFFYTLNSVPIFGNPQEKLDISVKEERPKTLIKYGYLDFRTPIIQTEFNRGNLRAHYPNLLANNSKAPIELNGFVNRWGHPYNKIIWTRINSSAESFAFIHQEG